METISNNSIRIAVLMTCFNRRELTLDCLRRLFSQQLPEGTNLGVTLVDDGSTDGTGAAVKTEFPEVTVLNGDGNLYWCGGMRKAWAHAAQADPDYYLLLNDDTMLEEGALMELLKLCGEPSNRTIAVASVVDPLTGVASYGGVCLGSGLAIPAGKPTECQTFNANCVMIPRSVFMEMGPFHSVYTHAMGDTDYGFHATKRGIRILASSHFLGSCELNVGRDVWRDRNLPRLKRLKALQSPKGLPFREWMEFNRRNSGWKWPYYTVSPILRILLGK
ncbi:MAG: glycosyltransferase [Luteolibacter sp.]